jgi:hypothetical protein
MSARSGYRNRPETTYSVNRIVTGVGLAIILLLILLDTNAVLFRLIATSRVLPPAAWAVTPPQWVD